MGDWAVVDKKRVAPAEPANPILAMFDPKEMDKGVEDTGELSFADLKANGVKTKLYNGNFRDDAASQHQVSVADELGEIDQVLIAEDGEVAFFSAYVTPEVAARLASSDNEVSPAIAELWTDSQKRKYPTALQHVAIVDHPVILGQGKFLTLSVDGNKGTASRVLMLANEGGARSDFKVGDVVRVKSGKAHDSMTADAVGIVSEIGSAALAIRFDGMGKDHKWYTAEELEPASESSKTMTMANEWRSDMTLLEKLKAKFAFGDDVTADNIDAMIEAKAKTNTDPIVSPEVKELAATVKAQGELIRTLSVDHKRLIDKEVATAETAFKGELVRLLSTNTITRAFHDHYLSLGKKHGYDFDILKGLPLIRTLASTKSNTLELATADEPDIGGGESDATRDARIKAMGCEPLRVVSA